MRTLWNAADRDEIDARLQRLSPDHSAAWGRLDAPRMLAHVHDALRMAFGELPTASRASAVLRNPIVRHAFIHWLPFPKGAPAPGELLARAPDGWATELVACRAIVARWGNERADRAWPEHPAFGTLSPRDWGVLAYKHTDHHLRQFGA